MRTVQQGNGILPLVAADGAATGQELSRLPASRDSLVRRPVVPPRSPSNPESPTELTAAIVEDADEILVQDARAGVTPAEMVELKLRSLLRTRGISTELAGRARPVRGR
jgi:hypothetical protein